MNYTEFLEQKKIKFNFNNEIEYTDQSSLYPFQNYITKIALERKRFAVFADCGLGKTRIQLVWAKFVQEKFNKPLLIIAPLSVSTQTIREGVDIGIEVNKCRTQSDVINGINITNYEMIEKFDNTSFCGIVLDESSILKNFTGKWKKQLIQMFGKVEYRLCCTATAAPNDLVEIVNHSEFLGYMNEKEAKAMFFIQDGNSTQKWRLKHHAQIDFWNWVGNWAIALRKPADIGFDDSGYDLPELNICQLQISSMKILNEGYLLPLEANTLNERREARVNSTEERLQKTIDLLAQYPLEKWVIWCDLNSESDMLTKAIPHGKEIRGSHSIEYKEATLDEFTNGELKVLITKPSIAGFGLNWQHCNKVIFFGLSDSYERFYQAVRRCWRYGQKRDVDVYVITSDIESATVRNIQRKEKETQKLFESIVLQTNARRKMNMDKEKRVIESNYTMILGDCIEKIDQVETESCGLTIFSPPFPAMYAYSDSEKDIGNCSDIDQMIEHFSFLIKKDKLMRVLKPGRNCCIHLTQVPAFKHADGYIGLKDFRGRVIKMMQDEGWIYYSEVTINKNPQVKAQRTKDSTLTFQGLAKDSAQCRPAMADYVLIFKKPGENKELVPSGNTPRYPNPKGWVTDKDWIEWAHPVWNLIKETNTLNVKQARDEKDERHLCPLQLDVIRRLVLLYTNPLDTVFSPFAGIGSEGYEALRYDRKFIGIELKESYFDEAIRNLDSAWKDKDQLELLDMEGVEAI